MDEDVMYDRASADYNGDYICVETWSGYYGSSRDPLGKQHLLLPGTGDEELGNALLDALSYSRVGKFEEFPDVYVDRDTHAKQYKAWIADLMDRYRYQTKRALFKNMNTCAIHRWRKNGLIEIFPWNHDRLEGWSPLPDSENVVVRAATSPAEIGAALRLAFSRCVDTYCKK